MPQRRNPWKIESQRSEKLVKETKRKETKDKDKIWKDWEMNDGRAKQDEVKIGSHF